MFTMLATDKVRLVGDPVALVIADTRGLAEDACELIEVDYEELPGVATAEQALDPAAPLIFEDLDSNIAAGPIANTYGDVEGAFAVADRIVRTRLHQHRHQNVPMETRGAVFSYDSATEELLVWIAGQGVALVQSTLAARTGIPIEKIRVRTGDVGGSFGLKIGAYREDVVCAAASKALGRPVKWIEDRSENLAASGQAREESFDIEAAVTAEGQILGLKVNMTADSGAYPGIGAMIGALIESMTPGPYKIGALGFERTAVITNKATYVAYRGPWAAETFLRERTIDLVARELGMEPLEIRRRNVAIRDEPPLAMVTGRSLAGITVKESLTGWPSWSTCPTSGGASSKPVRRGGISASVWPAISKARPVRGMEAHRSVEKRCACVSTTTAAWSYSPARCLTARATRPRSPRSPPTSSAYPSTRSRSSPATPTWYPPGSQAAAGRRPWRAVPPSPPLERCDPRSSTRPPTFLKQAPKTS